MLDLAVTGSATTLPDALNFDKDREASSARMNRAMEYLYLRLAAATALQPEFESAIAELQAVGLDRLNEVLAPIFAESTVIAAQLGAIRAAWLTGAPLNQLLYDLNAQVTARLATVDAAVAAQLSGVAGQLAAQNTAVTDKLASLSPTAKWAEASIAEARAATASRLISAAVLWAMQAYVPLGDAASVAPNLKAGSNFTWTIAGNRVLANPIDATAGQEWSVLVTQGGAGGFVMSFGSAYVPDDLTTYPVLNGAAGAVTELRMRVTNDGKVRISGGKPTPSKRVHIISFETSGVFQTYRPTKVETVQVTFQDYNQGAALNWGRSNIAGAAYENQASLSNGQSAIITLTAAQVLQFSTNASGSYVHIVEQ